MALQQPLRTGFGTLWVRLRQTPRQGPNTPNGRRTAAITSRNVFGLLRTSKRETAPRARHVKNADLNREQQPSTRHASGRRRDGRSDRGVQGRPRRLGYSVDGGCMPVYTALEAAADAAV
jgi:hypothetical protein